MSDPGVGCCGGRPTERDKTHKCDMVAVAVDAGERPSIANRTEVQRFACRCRVLAVLLRCGDAPNADSDKCAESRHSTEVRTASRSSQLT